MRPCSVVKTSLSCDLCPSTASSRPINFLNPTVTARTVDVPDLRGMHTDPECAGKIRIGREGTIAEIDECFSRIGNLASPQDAAANGLGRSKCAGDRGDDTSCLQVVLIFAHHRHHQMGPMTLEHSFGVRPMHCSASCGHLPSVRQRRGDLHHSTTEPARVRTIAPFPSPPLGTVSGTPGCRAVRDSENRLASKLTGSSSRTKAL